MELQEGLEFYRRCLKHCDDIIAELYATDIPPQRKQALIDKELDTRNEIVKRIDFLEELIR